MEKLELIIKSIFKEEIDSRISVLKSELIEKLELKAEKINDELLTEKEAAAYLKRSKTSMYRLRRDGMIPYHRYGKKVMYRKADLDLFITNNLIQ